MDKKGIGNYVIVIIIVSVLVTGLLYVIMDATISYSNPKCNTINIDANILCKSKKGYEINIINRADIQTIFYLNDYLEKSYYVDGNESKKIYYKEEDSFVKFMPGFINEKNKIVTCINKAKYLSTEGLKKC
jgi:hypothetical protein